MCGLTLLAAVLGPAAAQAAPPVPDDIAALLRSSGCMSCHGIVRKQVGPGFAQIAERYRGDATAPARLAGKIRNGSVGTWGRVIMPRQSLIGEADAARLAAWVLAQPAPP